MIMTDPKKALTTVIGRRREPSGSTSESPMVPSEMMSEEREMDPRHEAAKDILSAIHEKHPAKLMEAMAAFHDLHAMRDNTEDAD